VLVRRAAIDRQDVEERSVYLRTDASEAEKQAARAAMIARPTVRRFVYWSILSAPGERGLSDRQLEARSRNYPGQLCHGVHVPPGGWSHQTISSARKSLVDAGLLYAFGAEIVNGRRHTTWRARQIGTPT
jgi:hypothetical protein